MLATKGSFPDVEDLAWLLAFLVLSHYLRIYLWALLDYDVRSAFLEVVATAESMAINCVIDPAEALQHGFVGVLLFILCWVAVRFYRQRFWKWDENGNPALVLAMALAGEQRCDLAMVLISAQFVGGWFGYRYILWVSSRKIDCDGCCLPLKVPILVGMALETLGSMLNDIFSHGLQTTYPCYVELHWWAALAVQHSVFTISKFAGIKFTGAVYNPMSALVRFRYCFIDKSNVRSLIAVYIISPILGAIIAVNVSPAVQQLSSDLHRRYGFEAEDF